MRRSIAIVAVGAFALGCVSVARVGERVPGAVIAERVALEIGCEGEPSDELTLQGAELAGDTLRLDLAHGGGCSEHSYRVCAAREVLESDPGQWVITVLHDAHGDACRAEIFHALEVSLEGRGALDLGTLRDRSVTVLVR